jgi:predicted SAM-dependent methyltransferase
VIGRARRSRQLDRYCRQVPPEKRRLFIGAGTITLKGWLATDLVPVKPSIVYMDATKRWPMSSSSFRYVVCEHMISQVPYDDGLRVLAEAQRVLVQGGVLRISTTDLDFFRRLSDATDPEVEQYVKWSNQAFGSSAERLEPANATHVVNRIMRGFGNAYIYDEPSLRGALARAGFRDIVRCEPGRSDHVELVDVDLHAKVIGDEANRLDSMVLEATACY